MEGFDFPTEEYTSEYPTGYEYNSSEVIELCQASQRQEWTIALVQTTIFLLVFLMGTIGNGLVIATFALYRRLKLRCMTDVFLFFLALSDLLLLLTLPLQIAESVKGSWEFGEVTCKLNRATHSFNTNAGLLLLACISIDRYLVVVRTRAVHRMSSRMLFHSSLTSLGVALTSVVLSLPDLRFSSVNRNMGTLEFFCDVDVWTEDVLVWKLWSQVAKIVGFCVPCLAMLGCYGAIGRVLIRAGGKSWRRQRTLHLMALLVVLFLLFQLPYTIILLLKIFTHVEKHCEEWTSGHLQETLTRNLSYVRCCLNPVLYALVGVRFRNDIARLLRDVACVCPCLSKLRLDPDRGSSVTPSSPAPIAFTVLPSARQSVNKFPTARDTIVLKV